MDKEKSTISNSQGANGSLNNGKTAESTGIGGGLGRDTARSGNAAVTAGNGQEPPRRYGAQAQERIRQARAQQEYGNAPYTAFGNHDDTDKQESFFTRFKNAIISDDESDNSHTDKPTVEDKPVFGGVKNDTAIKADNSSEPQQPKPNKPKGPEKSTMAKPPQEGTPQRPGNTPSQTEVTNNGRGPASTRSTGTKPQQTGPSSTGSEARKTKLQEPQQPKVAMAQPQQASQGQALGKINPKKQAVDEPRKFSMTDKVSAKDLGLPTINQSIKLEESPPPRKSQLNIFAIAGFFVAFVVWSMYTVVDEVAVASGQVIPTGFIKSVQHLEGGIVAEVMVKDGDVVERGQILLRLDGESSNSDLEQTLVRRHALEVQAERLRAIGTGVEPDFAKFKDFPDQELVRDQKAIYDMQRQNLEDQISVINTQIEQKKASLTLHMGRLSDLQKQLEVAQKQRDVNEKLIQKRLVTRTAYLESQREVHEVATDVNQANNQIQETKKAMSEHEQRIIETKTRVRNDALKEMGSVTSEIAQLDEAITRLKDKVKRLEVVAPSSGVVNGLKATSLRGVVQPGEEIMQIVPRTAMEVEARVDPKDMGNVKVGQEVRVKVSAFDYAKYGDIPGNLHSLSASTFKDEEGKPYYRALVKLSKYHVGNDARQNNITPGMTATVDIDTGEKPLFDFFIKPIIKALDTSFRER